MTANNDVEYSKYGTYDAVVGDKLVKNVYFKTILVSNQTERDALENLIPGTIVATYGFANVWQLKPDGTWASL